MYNYVKLCKISNRWNFTYSPFGAEERRLRILPPTVICHVLQKATKIDLLLVEFTSIWIAIIPFMDAKPVTWPS